MSAAFQVAFVFKAPRNRRRNRCNGQRHSRFAHTGAAPLVRYDLAIRSSACLVLCYNILIPFLGKGELRWREGFSAPAPVTVWCTSNGLPPGVQRLLDGTETFAGAERMDGFCDRETNLRDGLARASGTDPLAIIRIKGALAVRAVGGKVEEPFGPLIGDQGQFGAGQKNRLQAGLQALPRRCRDRCRARCGYPTAPPRRGCRA